MKVEKISLVDLEPAEYNPRKISEQELVKLENSINEFGLVDPIIINLKNNKIIGGHQRYEALYNKYTADNDFQPELNLIRLGDIGWVFEDTELKISSEAQEKALNLALNKISGEWDTVKLQPLLEEIQLSNLDSELTGFEDIEISELFPLFDDTLYDDPETIYCEGGGTYEGENIIPEAKVTKQKHTFYLIEDDEWKIGNHTLKIGEFNPEDRVNILIDGQDMVITFENLPGENHLTKFQDINKECKGLTARGLDS